MKTHYSLHPFISNSEWASKLLLILLVVSLPPAGYANLRVQVNEFQLQGSGEIIISPDEMTHLLWRNLEDDIRFDVQFGYPETPNGSLDFIIDGACLFEGNDYFELNWTILPVDDSYEREFFFQGNGLKKVRKALSSSLDSMLSSLTITTNPDSARVVVDGIFRGRSPLTLKDIPFGWHLFQATSPEGLVFQDSFHLTQDTTIFHFVMPTETKVDIAYLHLLSPPRCELYVNGVHLSPTYNQIFKLTPGEAQIHLVSPQYGTRNLTLSLTAGDTVSIGFFTPGP